MHTGAFDLADAKASHSLRMLGLKVDAVGWRHADGLLQQVPSYRSPVTMPVQTTDGSCRGSNQGPADQTADECPDQQPQIPSALSQ